MFMERVPPSELQPGDLVMDDHGVLFLAGRCAGLGVFDQSGELRTTTSIVTVLRADEPEAIMTLLTAFPMTTMED